MIKTSLSGIQVSGKLHLGNYLGALKNWIALQNQYHCYFFLADLHSITVPQDPKELKQNALEIFALYLACGLDPQKSVIFMQSHIKEHSELAWILNCVTPFGWLNRMTQFKEKSLARKETVAFGLFAYPVLMAADILIYKPDIVPVGEDQKQHVELTRDIACLINNKFGHEVLPLPKFFTTKETTRIMSLRDGTKKMSKSDESDYARINIHDLPEIINDKIKRAKTDSINFLSYNEEARPEISNLLNIFSSLSGKDIDNIVSSYSNFNSFKKDLADLIISVLSPIRIKFDEYMQNQDHLLQILHKGANEARKKAKLTLDEIKELFGFIL